LIPFVQLSVEEEEKVSFPSTDVRRWPSLHSRHASSKRHDPADKFQSSSLPTPPLLHFFIVCYLCLCAIGAASNNGRLPATNHRPNFISRPNAVDIIRLPGKSSVKKRLI
jgi:hypothetical protein